MKLVGIYQLEGILSLESGLRIGSNDTEAHIGGIDHEVVKHPFTGEPYIPGSSIKGKVRSLLEWRSGAVKEEPLNLNDWKLSEDTHRNKEIETILKIFGVSGDSKDESGIQRIGPTRVAFWDCFFDKGYLQKLQENNLPYTEVKFENKINRISGVSDGGLRQLERVPAGALFTFKLTLKKFEGDDDRVLNTLLEGLKLLEWDSLGGSGSRGYGKVKFKDLTLDGVPYQETFDGIKPF